MALGYLAWRGQRQGLSPMAWLQDSLFLLLGCIFSHSPCDPTTLTPTCRHSLAARLCARLCRHGAATISKTMVRG